MKQIKNENLNEALRQMQPGDKVKVVGYSLASVKTRVCLYNKLAEKEIKVIPPKTEGAPIILQW